MKLTCYDIQYMLLIKIYMFIVISCSEIDFQGDQEKFKHLHLKVFFSRKGNNGDRATEHYITNCIHITGLGDNFYSVTFDILPDKY